MRNLENDIESNEKNEIEIKAKTHSNRCWVRRGTHFCFHFPFAFVTAELNGIFRMGKLCSSNSLCTAHSLTNFSIVFKPRKRLEVITDDKMDEIKHSQICYHDKTPHHDYQAPTKLSSTFQLEKSGEEQFSGTRCMTFDFMVPACWLQCDRSHIYVHLFIEIYRLSLVQRSSIE